jgi:hypothetical protein
VMLWNGCMTDTIYDLQAHKVATVTSTQRRWIHLLLTSKKGPVLDLGFELEKLFTGLEVLARLVACSKLSGGGGKDGLNTSSSREICLVVDSLPLSP